MGTKEIEAIIQRLKRSSQTDDASAIQQPPNQAQARIGQSLGQAFLASASASATTATLEAERADEKSSGREIVELLKTCNPAVPSAFFRALQSRAAGSHNSGSCIPGSWISTWIHQSQDEHPNLAKAILSFYVWHCRQSVQHGRHEVDAVADRIVNTYLQLPLDLKLYFVTRMAEDDEKETATSTLARPLLSPMMAASVLSLATPLAERTAVLGTILRNHCSLSGVGRRRKANRELIDTLSWHVEALTMLLDSNPDEQLANGWLAQILDFMASIDDGDIASILESLIQNVFPRFLESSVLELPSISLLYVSLQCKTTISEKAMFETMTMVLSTPLQADCSALLTFLLQHVKGSSPWTARLCHAVSLIFGQDEELESVTTQLLSSAFQGRPAQQQHAQQKGSAVLPIFGVATEDLVSFLELATRAVQSMDANTALPALQQNVFFLLSCGMLLEYEAEAAKTFAAALLQKFPHLGIPMLPILLDWAQEGAADGQCFLQRFEFLCKSVVHDPHCAQEVWRLVSDLMKKEQPLLVRLAAMRMLPTLCANNRRLYRRIVDTLGNIVSGERQAEIRLSIMAVVQEMAKQDLIRDVSDVIGWVQTYLSDEVPSIVHLSIMTLHFMVVNGELDFDLVVKVLDKRLCAIGDIEAVLQLPPLVIEALAVLLGDGEVDDEDAEDEEDEISPQLSSAVIILLALADSSIDSQIEAEFASRIKSNVLSSLSNYSLEALGIDEYGVKAVTMKKAEPELEADDAEVPEVSQRYILLSTLVMNFVNDAAFSADDASSVEVMTQKLVAFEEEVLGTTIWQKGHKSLSDTKKGPKAKASKSALAKLPKPASIYESYESDPSASTAIASLLCCDGTFVDRLVDFAGDLSNETLSPTMRIFNIQGWLHAMSRLWSRISSSAAVAELLNESINEIRGWLETVGDADYVYLALSSLALYVPDNLRLVNGSNVELGSIVETIITEVEGAFKGHQFSDLDTGHLCLALVGIRSLHGGNSVLFGEILERLLQAGADGTGSICLFFGLSFIAQSIPTGPTNASSLIAVDRRQRQRWVGQILGCLLTELHSYFSASSSAVLTLIASFSSASTQPGLVEDLKALDGLPIQQTSMVKAKGLLMSLSSCLPSLIGIHQELVHAILQVLLKLPIESGSEYALSSLISNDATASLLKSHDLDLIKQLCEMKVNGRIPLYLSATVANGNFEGTDWLKQNKDAIAAATDMHMLIPFVGSFPVLGTGEASISAPAKLSGHVTPQVLAMVLELIGTSYDENSIMLKGMLSSMSLSPISTSMAVTASSKTSTVSKRARTSLDTKRIPTPNDGTLLYQIVSSTRTELDLFKADTGPNLPRLCYLLRSLKPLSLPGQFATDLLGPLINENTESKVTLTALDLLLSQFKGRRRAAMEGRDFVDLGVRVMTHDPEKDLFGQNGHEFLSGMSDLIRKSSTDLAEKIVTESWQNCLHSLSEYGNSSNALAWLCAMKPILSDINSNSSMALSPRTSGLLQLMITDGVFKSLVSCSRAEAFDEIFDELTDCLFEIPFAVLEDRAFFDLNSERNLVSLLRKARCTAVLVSRGYVEAKKRSDKLISSLVSWFSKLNLGGDVGVEVYRAGFTIASALKATDDDFTAQVIQLLLEAMLINGDDSAAMHLLAFTVNNCGKNQAVSLTAHSVRGIENLPTLTKVTLEKLWDTLLQETPRNLASFAARTKAKRIITNRLVQIYNSWTDRGAPVKKVELLLRMLNTCKSADVLEKDVVAIIACRLSKE